tara:strand:+ start:825 stop:1406 length:582 start_codon:yes stop_codon:yes gene_type:complete
MSKKTIESLSETYVEGMSQIYLLIDMNGLTYIGTTRLIFSDRWNTHLSDKKCGNFCSSQKLDWSTVMVYHLETCSNEDKSVREGYWMTRYPDCVNIRRNLTKRKVCKTDKQTLEQRKEIQRAYYQRNSKAILKYKNEYYAKNTSTILEKKRQYYNMNKEQILFKARLRNERIKNAEKLTLIETTDFLELINNY